MKQLANLFIICFSLLLLIQCSKDTDFVTLNYSETKCSDAWKTNEGSSEEDLKVAFTDYLDQELKVSFDNLSITFDEEISQDCEACSCTTGRILTITVAEGNVAILEDNGFKLKE